MDVTATGPEMWMGKLGHFLVILSFISALLSAISYGVNSIQFEYSPNDSWKKIGKTSFIIHAVSLIAFVGLLFWMVATKRYHYNYVYQHASNDLPFQYLFAAFWEGQEGSTMLWAFWHVILGLILLKTAKKWESPVIGTLSLVQVFLVSMILGIYFFGYRIGASPFSLLRTVMAEAPIFAANPDFVPKDGQGLNELLRNYWMVIHPPTVFLGFAAITIPFCYAIGALLWRKLQAWITPTLPWALLAGGVLGLGVLMGGAWAYEALSFGGFWVWDPVENASLVPWLLIVAALHLMLVFRATSYSGIATFVLTILSFLMVAYSTFLTKSGVLGESSVHSFVDIGMSGQLIVFILFFWWLSFTLLLSNNRLRLYYTIFCFVLLVVQIAGVHSGALLVAFIVLSFGMLFTITDFPKKKEEEALWSREFWMFFGSLVLMISALHISLATSVPVYNNLFGSNYSVFEQSHFDSYQVFPAFLILLLSGFVLFLPYGGHKKVSFKKFYVPILLAGIVSAILVSIYSITQVLHVLLIWVAWFSFFANLDYFITYLKGKMSVSGSTIAHIGFALLIAGIVVSQSKKMVVTKNLSGQVNTLTDDEELNLNNILLYEGEPVVFDRYKATFLKDFSALLREGVEVEFEQYDKKFNKKRTFILKPKFKSMGDAGMTADPAIRRGLFQDFFTHISLINLGNEIDSTRFETFDFTVGDTIQYDRVIFILESMKKGTKRQDVDISNSDVSASAQVKVLTNLGEYDVEPVYVIQGNQVTSIEDVIEEEKLAIRIEKIDPKSEKITLGIKSGRPFRKYILLKAMVFPLINLVWIGSILMFVGFIISMIQRNQQRKIAKQ